MYRTGPNRTSAGSDEAAVFKHARDRFFQHLSSEDREAFTRINSSTELLDDFKRLQKFVKDDSRWMKVFSAVKNCSDQLQPYFDIIGIITQSHPEWAAVAWGALRLVLQLASNFVGFFEKLADVLSQVASLIPAYSDVLQFDISHPTIRFRMSLGKFYEDLLEFFQAVTRLFTQRSGKLKRTPVVIGQLLWQPFDVRFKNFLERLEFHRRVLRLELDVLQFTATQSFFQTWTQERIVDTTFQADARHYFKLVEDMRRNFTGEKREKLVEAIKVWICPPRYAESYERSIAAREPGTAKWLFDVNAYKTWKHTWNDAPKGSDLTGVLWVTGNPGTGKTVLASSCVQELRYPLYSPSQTSPSVAYFFFEAGNLGTCKWNDALRAILAQILQQNMPDDTILDFFAVSMSSERREGQVTSTYNEMIDLLASLIKYLGRFYLVLDGIDECNEPDEILLDLWKLCNFQGLRIVLFSRPNVGFLRRILNAEQRIYLTPASHAMDLEIYFRRDLERLRDLRLLPPTVVLEELIANLQLGADGMFLWARLMMTYLRSSAFSSSRRISIISNLETPERLDEMYDRIIELLSRGLRHEQALVRTILLWLTFGESPLSCSQLNDILGYKGDALPQTSSHNYSDDIKEFENAVVITCGGLVEFRHTECHFIHYSALDYFRSHCSAPEACVGARSGSIEYFFPPNFDAHTELATACLSYVVFRAPAEPLSGNITQPANVLHVDAIMPFLRYAALKWPRHLLGTLDNPKLLAGYAWDHFREKLGGLLRLLSRFLLSKIIPMSWIETVYTCAGHHKDTHLEICTHLSAWADEAGKLLSQFAVTCCADLPQTLTAFSHDVTLLFKHWNSTLFRYPNQIWTDATAFTTSPFFQQSSALSLKILRNTTRRHVDSGTKPFNEISRFRSGSALCATLTIWSSKHFKDCLSQITPQTSIEELRKVSIGWTAQYEVYNTDLQEPELNGEWQFDLEADEIMQQIQFFSKVVPLNTVESGDHFAPQDLAIHFPVSIGNNLDIFTVLRTVYIRKCFSETSSSVPHKSTNSWIILPIPVQHCEQSTLLHCSSLPSSRGEAPEGGTRVSRVASAKIDNRTAFRLVAHNDYLLYYAIRGTSLTRRSGGAAEDDYNGTNSSTRVSTRYRNGHGSGSLHINIPRNVKYENGIRVSERCEDQYSHNAEYHNIDNNNQSREGEDDLQTISTPGYNDEHCDDDDDTADDTSISGHSENVPENECMATSVAVFSMAGARQGEAIHLLDYIENASEDKYIGKYAFHPTLPLLAIHCGSEESGSIVLWNFRSSECLKHVPETVPRFQTLVEGTVHWTESLQFSTCGKQVIIEEYLAERPTVIPVGKSVLYSMAQELQDLPPATHSGSAAGEAHPVSLARTMILPQNEIVLLDPRSSTRLDFHPNSVHTDLELVKSDGSFQTVQPLLTLPNRSDIRHINVTLLPSRDMHTKSIRIMMTKSPKLFCNLANADEDTPTAIVEKDTRALFHARKSKCGPGNLHSWESVAPIVSSGSSAFQSVDMTTTQRKRPRLSDSGGNSVQNGHALAEWGPAQVSGT